MKSNDMRAGVSNDISGEAGNDMSGEMSTGTGGEIGDAVREAFDGAARRVRLQVEVVLEVSDAEELTGAALRQIESDEYMPQDERAHAQDAVQRDEAEALAYLVDPFDLLSEVPGVELVQASWSSTHVDQEAGEADWDLYEDE